MDAKVLEKITDLAKALEAGYALGPVGSHVQGAALQVRDLSAVMKNVTFGEKHLTLQKLIPTRQAKSLVVEYRRQLSYGQLGGSASLEVSAGQQNQGDYVSGFTAMAFYVTQSVVSLAATLVQTFDGQNNEEREAKNAAMKIAGDIELDLFRGKADFSNAGIFDGSPGAWPQLAPGMVGIDPQIRVADDQLSASPLDMLEYGAGQSVILNVGGVLQQANLEDGMVSARMNFGEPDTLYLDPLTLAAYNKLAYGKERIWLANSPQQSTGAQLGQQWTSGGPVKLQESRFLSGKERAPAVQRTGTPGAPTVGAATASSTTGFENGDVFSYVVSGQNELGEGVASAAVSITISADGQQVNLTITPSGTTRFFNVYRSAAGSAAVSSTLSCKFIGRVAATAGSTTFNDLGNFLPGSVTGFLLDKRNMERPQLTGFTSMDVHTIDTAKRRLYTQMECVQVATPRFSVLFTNLTR